MLKVDKSNRIVSHRVVRRGNDWCVVRNDDVSSTSRLLGPRISIPSVAKFSTPAAQKLSAFTTHPSTAPTVAIFGGKRFLPLNSPPSAKRLAPTVVVDDHDEDEVVKAYMRRILSTKNVDDDDDVNRLEMSANRVSYLGAFGKSSTILSRQEESSTKKFSNVNFDKSVSDSLKNWPDPNRIGRKSTVSRRVEKRRDAFSEHLRLIQRLTDRMYAPQSNSSNNPNAGMKENVEDFFVAPKNVMPKVGGCFEHDKKSEDVFFVNPKYSSVIQQSSYNNQLTVEPNEFNDMIRIIFDTAVSSSPAKSILKMPSLSSEPADPISNFSSVNKLKFNFDAPEVGFVNGERLETKNYLSESNAFSFNFEKNEDTTEMTFSNSQTVRPNVSNEEWAFAKAPAHQQIVWPKMPPPIAKWFQEDESI